MLVKRNLKRSDIISLHLHLNEETENFINQKILKF